uniref:Tyrosine-protein kinase n=1 Tax=Ascaris lumbricoides TaxID=6252 RepID=A0A0M3IEH0_ASCLU
MYECHCLIESAWRLAGSAKKMKTGTTQECKTRRSTTTGSAAALEDEVREYFHGLLPREDLTALLLENGDFLVRLSEPEPGEPRQIVLSMMYDKGSPNFELKHIVIHTTEDGKCKVDKKVYLSVPEMIETHLRNGEPLTAAVNTLSVLPEGEAMYLQKGTVLKRPITRQPWELSHDDITLVQKIGEGAFGEVHRGQLRLAARRQADVAIKIAKTDKMTKEKIKEMMKEARLMRNYDHPNVVKIYGVVVEREPLMIVMEFITGGALDEYLRKNGNRVRLEEKLSNMCAGAAWGIEYLHYMNCIHRDIAARNCLYTNRKHKSDVYSFGIMVWEIFTNGSEPYQDMVNGEVQQKVAREFEAYTNVKPPLETAILIKRTRPKRVVKMVKKTPIKMRDKTADAPLSLDDTMATSADTTWSYKSNGDELIDYTGSTSRTVQNASKRTEPDLKRGKSSCRRSSKATGIVSPIKNNKKSKKAKVCPISTPKCKRSASKRPSLRPCKNR